MTRTSHSFEFVNTKLTIIWIIGGFFRYCVLLPGRICILTVGLTYLVIMTKLISFVPWIKLRNIFYEYAARTCFRILARSISADLNFHNRQYRPKSDGICVANHTTPIDVVILSCDRSYALVGQAHKGMFGVVQRGYRGPLLTFGLRGPKQRIEQKLHRDLESTLKIRTNFQS